MSSSSVISSNYYRQLPLRKDTEVFNYYRQLPLRKDTEVFESFVRFYLRVLLD